jgi:hypothetical protein
MLSLWTLSIWQPGGRENHDMARLKVSLVILTILFCLLLGIYVSIPDFPRDAYPWEIMLWGESSQWWSEISWIFLFCIFTTSLIFILGWSKSFPNPRIESYQKIFRIVILVAFLSLLWNFSAVYFRFDGWSELIILDRGGYLHGVFYLGVCIEGLWLFAESLAFVSKIVPRLRDGQSTWR